ncbi:polymeric immunoglobulin receptor-like isoform X2 [Parambassis ranga]|uniref:polymeric immunoglobulin receptor-like isoform X2 n=1 Tax=Parambassis ranga TaxID=210632 RepID=UPI0010426095|nr:polymeric immunoglobulin receptor-like isoform X2 [Parambassis ranga]
MRSLILLILSLMTGSEAQSEWKCKDGWVNFTCGPKTSGKYQITELVNNKTIKDQFIKDHSEKILTVKQLEHEDFGKCNKQQEAKIEVFTGADPCPRPSVQTAYRSAETIITCDPGDKHKSTAGFFCKDDNSSCKNISSGISVLKSNRKFTVKNTTSGFMVSISNVSRQDAGVYWCGVKRNDKELSVVLRKINLQVKDITKFIRTAAVGQNLTYWCDYKRVDASYTTKFICKGEDPSTCQRVISSKNPDVNGKFSMTDNSRQRNINVTVREVTPDDGGTYWCGAESEDEQHKTFIQKLILTVVSPTTPPAPSSQTATIPKESHSSSEVKAVIIRVAVLLLFVAVLIFIYKIYSHSKTKGNAAAQQVNESCIYEEIQEGLQQSHNGINTIYETASPPTSDSAELQ